MDYAHIFTFSAILLLIFHIAKSSLRKKKENLPPSPPYSLPILGHLYLLKKPLHHSLARLSSRYGPLLLLRFGTRSVLVVSSAELANECFTTNDIAFANRPIFPSLRLTSYNHSSFGSIPYGSLWREKRRIVNNGVLSTHRLTSFSDVRLNEAKVLIEQLFRDSTLEGFTRVEFRSRLFRLTMNVIMKIMVGKGLYGEESSNVEVQQFKEIMQEGLSLSGVSNIGDFLPPLIGWFARRKVKGILARHHHFRDQFLQTLINERRREMEDKEAEVSSEGDWDNRTMIDSILSLQISDPEQYNDCFIKSIIKSLLSAGTDTLSNSIEWAMSLLLNNPEKLEKVWEEMEDKLDNGRLLDESDLPKLVYLNCVINETLRMFPPGPLLVPHESSKECKVGGYTVPSGTILLVNAYMIQRDPKIWFEPTKFTPERFLLNGKSIEEMKMFPFGMGRRRCPGEALAMKEMGLVLGNLIRCFEWKRNGLEEVNMKEGSGLTMPRENPLQALCKPRQSMICTLSQL